MSAPLELSLVIPVYNERDNLPVLVEEIGRALAGRAGGEPYEIVAVDDGSTDGSLDVLKVLKREHPEIHIVALAANAGQSAAFGAGFGAARAAAVQRRAPVPAHARQDAGGAGHRSARAPPEPPLREDEVRDVEPRIPRLDRRARGALDAASGVALPGAGGAAVNHDEWVEQIDLELDGELSLPERASLARHLAGCRHCAEAQCRHPAR